MSARNFILIVAAVLITAGTVYLARDWLNSQRPEILAAPPAPKIEGALVLVAAADLPAGVLLQDKHLRWQIWPSDAVPETYFLKPKGENQPSPIIDLLGADIGLAYLEQCKCPVKSPYGDGRAIGNGFATQLGNSFPDSGKAARDNMRQGALQQNEHSYGAARGHDN